MPNFVYAQCPCGRKLRVASQQGGSVVRCWDCQREVVVPRAEPPGHLIRDLTAATSRVLADPVLLAGAGALTAAMLVPKAGPWLGLVGLALAFAHGYESQDVSGTADEPDWRLRSTRWLLAAVAALALVAPLLLRNSGRALPPNTPFRGASWVALLALSGWAAMPIVLAAAHRPGGRSPGLAVAALGRHPLATIAALLIVPAGLLATEAIVAVLAWTQGLLPLLAADLLPDPELVQRSDGPYLVFNLDGKSFDASCGFSHDPLIPVYFQGLRRGFTLTGTIPASLSLGSMLRRPAWMYKSPPWQYLTVRIVLTFLILWATGLLVVIQTRWLGVIAGSGPRVPAGAGVSDQASTI